MKYLLLLILGIPSILLGQNSTQLVAQGQFLNGEIKLRWAPPSVETFEAGIIEGYNVYRLTKTRDGVESTVEEQINSKVKLNASPIFPKSLAEWNSLSTADENFKKIAEASIYGDEFEIYSNTSTNLVEITSNNSQAKNRYSFGLMAADQDFTVATYMGLGIVDTTIPSHTESYIYIIESNNTSSVLKTGSTIVDCSSIFSMTTLDSIEVENGDKAFQARLDASPHDETYTLGYTLERKTFSGTYEVVNELPILHISTYDDYIYLSDTLAQNNVEYEYRVRGRTLLNGYGPYTYFVVEGKDAPLDLSVYIENINEDPQDNSFVIEWVYPPQYDNKIQEINIYSSGQKNGGYNKIGTITTASIRMYKDISPLSTSYYYIELIDNNGYTYESFPVLAQLNDMVAPVKPSNLACTISNEGKVNISWDRNTELDVKGYQVFFSNQLESEFSQLTTKPVQDSFFNTVTTLNTLKEEIYYKVRAIDFRENYGEFSSACQVLKPDIIPPIPPKLISVKPVSGAVDLKFSLSTSADVGLQLIERKISYSNSWERIIPLSIPEEQFADTTFIPYEEYQYRLVAIDNSNNKSYSETFTIHSSHRPIDSNHELDLYRLNPKVKARLRIENVRYANVSEIVVYRATTDKYGNFYRETPYENINFSNLPAHVTRPLEDPTTLYLEYIDLNAIDTNQYKYRLLVKFKNGRPDFLTDLKEI